MSDFTPKLFPEMKVYFDFDKGQEQTWDDPGYPEEFDFTKIEINEIEIGQELFNHLVETFADSWIKELWETKDDLAF
jgi:hypothetical protein